MYLSYQEKDKLKEVLIVYLILIMNLIKLSPHTCEFIHELGLRSRRLHKVIYQHVAQAIALFLYKILFYCWYVIHKYGNIK